MKLINILLVALFLTSTQAIPTNVKNVTLNPVSRQDYAAGHEACDYANQARAAQGLAPLYFSSGLTELGTRHSNWMASYGIFEHQDIHGLGVWVGDQWLSVSAENIAMSTPRSSSAAYDAHEQWYHSPGHYANIMGHHTHCGVGIIWDHYGRWWATQLFGYNDYIGDDHGGSISLPHAEPVPHTDDGHVVEPQPVFHEPMFAPAPAPAPEQSSPNRDEDHRDSNPLLSEDKTPTSNVPDGLPTSMLGTPLSI